LPEPTSPAPTVARLAAEKDYAPWSLRRADGALAGIAVDVTLAACKRAGLTCDIVEMAHTDLLPALGRGDVQGIITGLHLTPVVLASYDATRPWYRSSARFFMKVGTELSGADPRSLAGRRIGVVKGSLHETFLNSAYGRSAIIPEADAASLMAAVQSGTVDVGFADSLHVKAWLTSPFAAACCVLLAEPFVDAATISRPLAMLIRRDAEGLRNRLDDALDAMDVDGETAKLFERYFP
jgi:polar amino acid transport system substrate-binding protein